MEDKPHAKSMVLELLFYNGEDVFPFTHTIKVPEEMKISKLASTVLEGYQRSGYAEEDFDLLLLRRDSQSHGMILESSKRLCDYDVKDNDQIEMRWKSMPIIVCVNLFKGEERNMELNAAQPVMNATEHICKSIGISHSEEFSLAYPQTEDQSLESPAVKWLDTSSSLYAQGVKSGDILLLRKKFFVKNVDTSEATETNLLLLKLLYHQLKDCYTSGLGLPTRVDTAAVSSLLHHIEQGSENISDEEIIKKVVPLKLQSDAGVCEKIVEAYNKDKISSLQKDEAKTRFVTMMCQPGMSVMHFPCQRSEEAAQNCFVISSTTVSVCSEDKGLLKPMQEWPLSHIKEWEGSKDHFRFLVMEEWHTVNTVFAVQIAQYLGEILQLISGQCLSPQKLQIPGTTGHIWDLGDVKTGGYSEYESHQVKPNVVLVQFPEASKPDVTVQVEHGKGKVVKIQSEKTDPEPKPKGYRYGRKQSYFGLGYQSLLQDYKLFHFVVLKKDIRPLLVNVTQPVDQIILKICATYGIPNPEQYYLWLPKGLWEVIAKYGGKPRKTSRLRKVIEKGNMRPQLEGSKSLREQYDFEIKPYVLHMGKCAPGEEVDADDSLQDLGEEWPDFEEPGLARQREFHQKQICLSFISGVNIDYSAQVYQCWCGVVQGDYPVDHQTAVEYFDWLLSGHPSNRVYSPELRKLYYKTFQPQPLAEESRIAARLTHIYLGDQHDFADRAQTFLPPMYCNTPGIEKEVEDAHKSMPGKDEIEAMEEVIKLSQNRFTYEGIFFDVEVLVSLLPWKRLKHRMFGVNHQGVFSVDPKSGKIIFLHRFSDIHDGCGGDGIMHLNFLKWDKEYYAYTYQAKEIMEILQLFIGMTRRGQIEQAPPRPEKK